MGTTSLWHNGIQTFIDKGTQERVHPMAPVLFYEDFLGAYLQKYTTAENTTALWGTVETNLNTAIGLVADGVNGVANLILDADDNAEVACLHFADNECLSLLQGLIFETRVAFSVLPTTGTETVQAVFGLAGAHNTSLDTVDVSAWFRVESAAPTALLWETDDDSANDDDNSTGITLVASTYHIYRIDATDTAAVKFYVDGERVGTGNMSGLTTTTCKVQPYFNVSKAWTTANTGTGTMLVDYVRVWQKRS
jgi:hypothetical protein